MNDPVCTFEDCIKYVESYDSQNDALTYITWKVDGEHTYFFSFSFDELKAKNKTREELRDFYLQRLMNHIETHGEP